VAEASSAAFSFTILCVAKSVTAVTAPINNWKLIVSDNVTGRPEGRLGKSNPGLGPTIVEAFAKQLDASLEVLMDTHGTLVSITHAPIALPAAA
jgi:two-component sensor histidine kinase